MQVVSSTARYIPNLDRISVLAATILLAYTLTGIISVPSRQIATQLPGFYIEIEINIQTVVIFLVTALAVSGTDWLLREHPSAQGKRLFLHWLLPALTAWIIGIPLIQGALGPYWWVGIVLDGGALILVLAAEYIVVESNDKNFTLASIGLSAIGYTLFFLLAITSRAAQLRLYLIVPILTLTMLLISMRTLSFRLETPSLLPIAGICAVIIAEFTIVAHYLPLSPIGFGLFLLGAAYGLINFLGSLATEAFQRSMLFEPALIVALFWVSAWWLG